MHDLIDMKKLLTFAMHAIEPLAYLKAAIGTASGFSHHLRQ